MADWVLVCPSCEDYAATKGKSHPLKFAIIWQSNAWFDKFIKEHGTADTSFLTRWSNVMMQHYKKVHNAYLGRPTDAQIKALVYNQKDLEGSR